MWTEGLVTSIDIFSAFNIASKTNVSYFKHIIKLIFQTSHTNSLYHILGAYVPLTNEGNIVVDGVLASCYPSAEHNLVHLAITPIHWFPQITQWILGEENGFQIYILIVEDLGRWVLPHVQSYDNINKVVN